MQEYPVRWITTELAVGYAPRSHNDLAKIRAQGIAAIVIFQKVGSHAGLV